MLMRTSKLKVELLSNLEKVNRQWRLRCDELYNVHEMTFENFVNSIALFSKTITF